MPTTKVDKLIAKILKLPTEKQKNAFLALTNKEQKEVLKRIDIMKQKGRIPPFAQEFKKIQKKQKTMNPKARLRRRA